MTNYTIDKTLTGTKIKAMAKEELVGYILEVLKDALGDENVRMVRTGNASKTNEVGVRYGTVNKDGEILDLCATIGVTVKEFEDRETLKKVYTAFDFEESANEYDKYVLEKAEKEAELKAKKEAKIAKDKARREAEE